MLANVIYHRASLLERSLAFILDLMLVNMLTTVMNLAGLNLSQIAVFFAYFVSFEGTWGKSMGKWAMGLEVVDKEGNTPGIKKSVIRVILLPVSFILIRPIHDSLSGTLVVRS